MTHDTTDVYLNVRNVRIRIFFVFNNTSTNLRSLRLSRVKKFIEKLELILWLQNPYGSVVCITRYK